MSKSEKILCAAALSLFTLILLFGSTCIVIEKATGYTFFINETFCIYRISPILLCGLGFLGDAVTARFIGKRKGANRIFRILMTVVIVFSLFAVLFSLPQNVVERKFYHENSPDGKTEIIVYDYQFLVVCGGEVYYRVDPLFVCKLKNEEQKHVEWFYEDYTVEWYDGYVIVDGYTYRFPERE